MPNNILCLELRIERPLKIEPLLFLSEQFLEGVAKLLKVTTSFVRPVSPSVCLCPSARRHGKTRLPLKVFSWNLIFRFFFKFVEKIQVSLTPEDKYTFFYYISFSSSQNEKCLRQKNVIQNTKTHTAGAAIFSSKIVLFFRWFGKMLYSGAGDWRKYGARTLYAG